MFAACAHATCFLDPVWEIESLKAGPRYQCFMRLFAGRRRLFIPSHFFYLFVFLFKCDMKRCEGFVITYLKVDLTKASHIFHIQVNQRRCWHHSKAFALTQTCCKSPPPCRIKVLKIKKESYKEPRKQNQLCRLD